MGIWEHSKHFPFGRNLVTASLKNTEGDLGLIFWGDLQSQSPELSKTPVGVTLAFFSQKESSLFSCTALLLFTALALDHAVMQGCSR